MGLKALTTIKHGDGENTQTFNVGDDVKGLDKETVESLQASGAVGSEQDLAALSPTAATDEIAKLQARIAELEGQGPTEPRIGDPITEAANEAAARESKSSNNQKSSDNQANKS